MGALHVIGINLKLGTGFYVGGFREKDVVVLLEGLRLLGVRGNHDGTVEGDVGPAAGNAFHKLGTAASGRPVVYQDAEIHLFVGIGKIKCLEEEFRAGVREVNRHVYVPGLSGEHHVLKLQFFSGLDGVRHARP